MDKKEMADNLLRELDIRYVEEALEPSPTPKTSPVQQFVRKPVLLAAAAFLVCLIAGGVFAAVYFHQPKETPTSGDPTLMAGPSATPTEMNTAPKQYHVRLISKGNSGEISGVFTSNAMETGGVFQSETARPELTVTFEGQIYHGVYRWSERYAGSGMILDGYDAETDSVKAFFKVNTEDRSLMFFEILSQNGLEGGDYFLWEVSLPVLPESEIEKAALRYAGIWSSMEDYTVSHTVQKGNETCADFYDYVFCRKVHGIETTDRIMVLISDRGIFHYAGAEGSRWADEHWEELSSFDVKAATEAAKEASHLTNPTVKIRRFGIDENGQVFLMLFLTGANEETPLLLGVTEE